MSVNSAELDNLVEGRQLQLQPPRKSEIDRNLKRAGELLEGAQNIKMPASVRFNLAYSAAYALAFNALRMAGYRTNRRGMVFQCVVHVLSVSDDEAATLITAHSIRNSVEYDSQPSPHTGFVEDLLKVTSKIQDQTVSWWAELRKPRSPAV